MKVVSLCYLLILSFLSTTALPLMSLKSITLSPSSSHVIRHISLSTISAGRHSVILPIPRVGGDALRITAFEGCVLESYVIQEVNPKSNEAQSEAELTLGLEQYLQETQLQLNLLRAQFQRQNLHVDLLRRYLMSQNSTSSDHLPIVFSATNAILLNTSSVALEIEAVQANVASITSSLEQLQKHHVYTPPAASIPSYLPHHTIVFSPPTTELQAQVFVITSTATRCVLEMSYVSDASWLAVYDVLLNSHANASIRMYATVKQKTGEDWTCEDNCMLTTVSPGITVLSLPEPARLFLSHRTHDQPTIPNTKQYFTAPLRRSYKLPRGVQINSSDTSQQVLLSKSSVTTVLYSDVNKGRKPTLVALFPEHSFALPAVARVYLDGVYTGSSYVDHSTTSVPLTVNHAIHVTYPQTNGITLHYPSDSKPVEYVEQFHVTSHMNMAHVLGMHDISHKGAYGDVTLSMIYPVSPTKIDLSSNTQLYDIISRANEASQQMIILTDIHSNQVLYVQKLAPHAAYSFVVRTVQTSTSDVLNTRAIVCVFVFTWLMLILVLTRRLWIKHAHLLLLRCKYFAKNESAPCCRDDEKLHDI